MSSSGKGAADRGPETTADGHYFVVNGPAIRTLLRHRDLDQARGPIRLARGPAWE